MNKTQRGIALVQIIWVLAGILVIAAAVWHIIGNKRDASVQFPTPYHGSVYFGHLQGYGAGNR